MNIIKWYAVIGLGFFLCQYPEIIQIITHDNPFYFGADSAFTQWRGFGSCHLYKQVRIIYVIRTFYL